MFCLSVIQPQPTRRTPVLDRSNTPLHRLLGLMCFSNWGRCKQLLVVGEDVMLNMMCVEDDDDILGVRDELDRPEYGTLWNTARDRDGCRLFVVDCNDLRPVV